MALALPRAAGGLFVSTGPAIERFAAKCQFDPATGCVVWVGGKTSGRGETNPVYGSFWDEKRRWFAHRWAAAKIHGFDIGGMQVDHYCPALIAAGGKPNTLCVEHVRPETRYDNNGPLRVERAAIAEQTAEQRRYWLFVHLGIEPPPGCCEPQGVDDGGFPLFDPPEWLQPFVPKLEYDECPF